MPVSFKRAFVLIIVFLLFFFSALEVYAGGQKEDRLPEAQKLIEEGKYNDAILILTDIMRTNPDQFTEAQNLIKEIKSAREKYNALYAQLIDVLNPPKGEAIDEDLAYKLIRDMESLDKTPNKAAVAAFAQARDTIVFAVTNRTFEDIMDKCTALLKEGKYVEAIDKYLSGFILHREFFEKKGYGNIILNQIDSDTAEIKSLAKRFESLLPLIDSASASVTKAAASGSIDSLKTAVADYRSLLISALNLKRNIFDKALHIDSIRASIQKEDESDIPYLSTLRVLSKGRVKSDSPEGIAGSIEQYWIKVISGNIGELQANLEKMYTGALESYDSGDYAKSIQSASDASQLADILMSLQNLWGGLVDIDKYGNPVPKGWSIIAQHLPSVLKTEEIVYSSGSLTDLDTLQIRVLELVKKVDGLANPEDIEAEREKLLKFQEDMDKIRKVTEKRKTKLAEMLSGGIDTADSTAVADTLLSRENEAVSSMFNTKVDVTEKLVRLQIDELETRIKQADSDSRKASSLVEGNKETIDGIEFLVKRPDTAASIINKSKTSLKKAESDLDALSLKISGYDRDVIQSGKLAVQEKRIDDLKAVIKSVYMDMNSTLVKAKDLNDKADNLYNLGYLRLDETYARYDRGDYDVARGKYFEAEKAFLKSLEYREDKAVRKVLTVEMPGLYDDIMTALNKKIIREVRELINTGKDYYNVEKFIKAEQTFQQAKERYKVTHEELNPEIENWLVKVKKALEATSGRVLVPTDPLYPEMIQILNIAEDDFNKGKKLVAEGKTDEADLLFKDAVKNIEYVKETFPRNFKASVLYLKILEFTEKDTFDTYFKSMYESAVAKIKTDPKSADDDLLALYAINPGYPGIKTSLYKSGIAAGRLSPPPAKVDIAKARNLYYKAKKIADADKRAQFPIAIAYLEESLQIDANFNQAAVLLDQLRTSTGGIVTSVMSDADQQKLRFAENLYVEGKYLEASIIINQLWKVPENRKSAKLNDLKKKVDARL